MRKEYRSVLREASAELEEKKSRFIASVKPVSSEIEAVEHINLIKAKYRDATHNVYAYCIGGDNIIQRFSDDGEPQGTAGIPVLEVIKRMELEDIVVVVTRYFGGTLLGAAGLVRAYSKTASMGIEAAVPVKKKLCVQTRVFVEYVIFGKVQHFIISKGYKIKDVIYEQDVEIIVNVPLDEINEFKSRIDEVTNAAAIVEEGDYVYVSEEE